MAILELIKLANHLDSIAHIKEANYLDFLIRKFSSDDNETSAIDWLQRGLDVIGLYPGLGEPADVVNAAISAGRDDIEGAVLSIISAIPTVGDLIGKGAKVVIYGARSAGFTETVTETAQDVLKVMAENPEIVKQLEDILKDIDRQIAEKSDPKGAVLYKTWSESILPQIVEAANK